MHQPCASHIKHCVAPAEGIGPADPDSLHQVPHRPEQRQSIGPVDTYRRRSIVVPHPDVPAEIVHLVPGGTYAR